MMSRRNDGGSLGVTRGGKGWRMKSRFDEVIEILERARPPASLDVAASLEAYAAFLAKQGLRGEARSIEARAAAIRGQ